MTFLPSFLLGFAFFFFFPSHSQSTCCLVHNHHLHFMGLFTLFQRFLHSASHLLALQLHDPSMPYILRKARSDTAMRSVNPAEQQDLITKACTCLYPVSHQIYYANTILSPQGCFFFFSAWKADSLPDLMKHSAA